MSKLAAVVCFLSGSNIPEPYATLGGVLKKQAQSPVRFSLVEDPSRLGGFGISASIIDEEQDLGFEKFNPTVDAGGDKFSLPQGLSASLPDIGLEQILSPGEYSGLAIVSAIRSYNMDVRRTHFED